MNLKFSAIGIAESNIDPSAQCTYHIPNYNSIYQNKMSGKKKGSGLGLYIHELLTYTKNDAFSILSDDIETLLVNIVNNSTPLILGIVYRPPSSSLKNFNEFFSKILSSIRPSNNTIIMGDFNINLLKNNEHFNRSTKISCAMVSRQLFQHRHIINPTAKLLALTIF